MTPLVAAALLFVALHIGVPGSPARGAVVARLGEAGYLGLYSVLALAALLWMISAFGHAPRQELWALTPGLALTARVLVFAACLFVAGGLTLANPAGIPLGARPPAAEASGLLRVTRHPLMWGFALWAAGHMVANGDPASLVLFGSFLVTALGGAAGIDRRRARAGGDRWRAFAAGTSYLPFAAILRGRNRLVVTEGALWWRLGLGVVLFWALLHFHPVIAGVSVS